jgi:hypothetical protein
LLKNDLDKLIVLCRVDFIGDKLTNTIITIMESINICATDCFTRFTLYTHNPNNYPHPAISIQNEECDEAVKIMKNRNLYDLVVFPEFDYIGFAKALKMKITDFIDVLIGFKTITVFDNPELCCLVKNRSKVLNPKYVGKIELISR